MKRKRHIAEGYTWSYSLDDWFDDSAGNIPFFACSLVIGILFILIGLGISSDIAFTARNNRINEPANYASYIARKETLEDTLEITEDVVNSQLYDSIYAFNSQLAVIKTKYTDARFKWNFTGYYNWLEIEPIKMIK